MAYEFFSAPDPIASASLCGHIGIAYIRHDPKPKLRLALRFIGTSKRHTNGKPGNDQPSGF
jgi:hypothetical protein